jgi:hypothetical protein
MEQLNQEEKTRLYSIFKKGVAVTKEEYVRRANSTILLVDGT